MAKSNAYLRPNKQTHFMKKIALSLFIVVLAATFTRAQNISIGARAGANFVSISESVSGGSPTAFTTRNSFLVGGYATIMFNDKVGIQPELFYSSMGAVAPGVIGGSTIYKLNYVSLPVLFRYQFSKKWNLIAGPQLGILASAKSDDTDIKSNLNSSDFGLTLGLGVDLGKMNIGARYYSGLTNITKSSGQTDKNYAVQVVVGYKLFGTK